MKDKKYTYEEYLQLEQDTNMRHEFWKGQVFAMAGGSRNHGEIASNINTQLLGHFRPKGCKSYAEGVKLELEQDNYYVYPDVILTCDTADDDEYVVKKPSLIVEVLSPSTAEYDRSIKLAQYRKIKSLRYYLLVKQTQPYVEIFGRNNEHELFTYDVAEGMDAVLHLPALQFDLPLSKVYEYIQFPPTAEP